MSPDLIDSNLIIYAARPRHDELRGYIADEAPAVSVMSNVETLGYRRNRNAREFHVARPRRADRSPRRVRWETVAR
jgi:hypothetical protein